MWKTSEITKSYLYKDSVQFAKRTAISQQMATQLHKSKYMYVIQDCLITMCVRNLHYGHNPKPFCDVL